MIRRKAVLMLDNTFTFGGAINSLSHLVKSLDRQTYEPVIVSGQPEDFMAEHFSDCTCYRFLPKLPWIDDRIYSRLLALPLFAARLPRLLLNLLRMVYWTLFIHFPEACCYYRYGKRHRVGLVHLNNILGSQASGIMAAKLLKVPCIAHLRDFEDIHPLTRFYARLINHHVAISGAIRENHRRLGIPDTKISLVHDAVDLGEFALRPDCGYLQREFPQAAGRVCFGLFGRVVDWKGTREFLQATRIVLDANRSAHAFVVGGVSDGDEAYMAEMRRLAISLDIDDRLTFTGFRKDVPELMHFMDLVVHASIRPEPFGMVLIEAMAMGKPVVATRAGGPLDIVKDGETGRLVPMGDVEELAAAISELIRQPDLRDRMGRAARKTVQEHFSSLRYAGEMEAIYREYCI